MNACSTLLYPSTKRLLSYISLCLLYHRSSGQQNAAQPFCSLSFSLAPRHLDCAQPCQCPEISKTEANPLGNAPSPKEMYMYNQVFSFSFMKKLGISSWSHGIELGRGTILKGFQKFSYCLECSWCHTRLGCRAFELFSRFVIKSMSSCIVAESVCLWEEEGSGASYSAILLMSLFNLKKKNL